MWIPQLPQSLSWDHNAHYHSWLLRQLPPAPALVLDAGCGVGALASLLASRAERVDAVDLAPHMIARARASAGAGASTGASLRADASVGADARAGTDVSAGARQPPAAGIRWITGDLLDPGLPLEPAGYDAVTAIASLHHLPLRPGLARLAGLVRPGGVLAVVGLYRNAGPADYALESVRPLANAAVGAMLALRGRAGKPHEPGMPVAAAHETLADISAAARALTPGARIRRRLFWRYSLLWHRPQVPAGELRDGHFMHSD